MRTLQTRYVTIPWLLRQRTRDLVVARTMLKGRRVHVEAGDASAVLDALVAYIDLELDSRDPRRTRRRATAALAALRQKLRNTRLS